MAQPGYNAAIWLCGNMDDPLPDGFGVDVLSSPGGSARFRLSIDDLAVILNLDYVPRVFLRENSSSAWNEVDVTLVEPLVGEITVSIGSVVWSGLASDARFRNGADSANPIYAPRLFLARAREVTLSFEQATNDVMEIGGSAYRGSIEGQRTISASFTPLFGYEIDLPFEPEPIKDFYVYNQMLLGDDAGFVIVEFVPSPGGPSLRVRMIGSGTDNSLDIRTLFTGRVSFVTSADEWTVPAPVSTRRWAWTST